MLAIWKKFVLLEFTDTDSKKLLLYILQDFHFQSINANWKPGGLSEHACSFSINYSTLAKKKTTQIFFHALIKILQSRLIIELAMEINKFSTLLTVNDEGLLQKNLELLRTKL